MNNKWVWTNPYLPQTLQISVLIGYFHGFFALIGLIMPRIFGGYTSFGWLLIALGVLGSFGVANVRLWGYFISLVAAILSLITFNGIVTRPIPLDVFFDALVSRDNLLNLMFQLATIALLLHPMSRNYVKKHFEKTIP